jgi:hypothetical protein
MNMDDINNDLRHALSLMETALTLIDRTDKPSSG